MTSLHRWQHQEPRLNLMWGKLMWGLQGLGDPERTHVDAITKTARGARWVSSQTPAASLSLDREMAGSGAGRRPYRTAGHGSARKARSTPPPHHCQRGTLELAALLRSRMPSCRGRPLLERSVPAAAVSQTPARRAARGIRVMPIPQPWLAVHPQSHHHRQPAPPPTFWAAREYGHAQLSTWAWQRLYPVPP